jgi:DNA (cytosine-5)-methyltransferase 1
MAKEYLACDFFAGCGGLSEGLEQAGLKVAVANEINKHASMTYKINHPNTKMIEKDIRKVKAREVIDITGPDIFLVAGGPPCQGVSIAGRKDINDPRNLLFKEFIKMVGKLEPRFFLMENVTGLLIINKGNFIREIEKHFEDIGYFVSKRTFNSIDFNVPQSRRRIFIIGSRKGKYDINSMIIKKTRVVTASDAIGDLDFLKAGKSSQKYLKPPSTDYQVMMRSGSMILHNHEAPRHNMLTMKRFSMLRQGESINSLPSHLRIKKKVMYRLNASEPARTVTTLPDDCIHYNQNRILTVRETARLQSFKDSYVFFGPKSTGGLRRKVDCPQYSQVGNSVPPLLAREIGKWLLSLN